MINKIITFLKHPDVYKKDFLISSLVGLSSAFLFGLASIFAGVKLSVLMFFAIGVGFPIVLVSGFIFLFFLSLWKKQFIRVARFAAVGTLSSSIEFSLINFLFFLTGVSSGVYFSVFKAITFTVAVINSYLFNKLWTFESKNKKIHTEFAKFFASNLIGLSLNVGVASFVVNVIGAPTGVSPIIWANFGVFISIFIAMSWNFLSYRFIVFRPKAPEDEKI